MMILMQCVLLWLFLASTFGEKGKTGYIFGIIFCLRRNGGNLTCPKMSPSTTKQPSISSPSLSMVRCIWLICDLLLFLVLNLVIECSANKAVTIQWRPELNWAQKLDISNAHLGSCPPSSISTEQDMLLFSVWLYDCGFRRVVMCLFCVFCVT